MTTHLSERGLVLAPVGRDSQIASAMLAESGINCTACASVPDLVAELAADAGFALVTEEALRGSNLHALSMWIDAQPEWSDFPFILLTSRGGGLERNPAAGRFLELLGNVSFLERPFHPTTLVSMSRAALRGRRRQYEARSRLESLRQLNETLESRVAAALAEQRVLADIVESTDAFVQVVDPNFRFMAINRASADEFERIFGVRPNVGDNVLELLAHLPDHLDAVRDVWSRALSGEEFTQIGQFGDPRRARRHYEMKFNTLRNRHGETIGAYQFVYDVTRRLEDEAKLRLAEDALRQAQKMEAVGQLTGGVAHDFNNLLMVISSGLRLLDRQVEPERRQGVVGAMRQAVERGTALTRQLLAFSRRRPMEQKPVDLGRQLLGMRELLDRSLGGHVEVNFDIAPDLWTVEIDPGELELAVLNLCVNARDAMPNGGSINITARNAGAPSDERVVMRVTDTGTGMSDEVMARVFEPFFTTKEVGKGSGLGLAQVYAFASLGGGKAAIESVVGEGTTVEIAFPRSHKAPESDVPMQDARNDDIINATPGARLGHVLLVEDDKEVAAMTVEVLQSLGFTVTHVASPKAALGELEGSRVIDIVFSDVMMPGGMSGVDLAHEIKRQRPQLPIILATGYVEAARNAISDGLEVLVKPYEIEALARALKGQLGAKQ